MNNKVHVFCTEERDGEQAGHKMSPEVKVSWARALEEAGVDVIEAGFPISSQGDLASVSAVASAIRTATVCALARTKSEDIQAAARALEKAAHPRIHTFIATSENHIVHKLRKPPSQVLEMAVAAVRQARQYVDEVQFSPEDAARTSPEYLIEVVRAVVAEGVNVVNIPDTVGYSTPWEYGGLITRLFEAIPDLCNVRVSTHCHDDLGLAVANSLAAVRAGARQIEGCFLGIGERAGNTAIERVIAALITRHDLFGVDVGFDTKRIGPCARLLSNLIGYPIPEHHAVVGSRAFAHSSGIHRDGINKDRTTYEIMDPLDYGWEGVPMTLGSHMGRSGLGGALKKLGYDPALVEEIYPRYTALADSRGTLSVEDLHLLVQEHLVKSTIERERLFDLNEKPFDYGPGHAMVQVRRNGESSLAAGIGDGPIEALFNAIRSGIGQLGEDTGNITLDDYHVVKGKGGPDAIAWVIVGVRRGNQMGYGRSGDRDTVRASALAYLYAINNLLTVPVAESQLAPL